MPVTQNNSRAITATGAIGSLVVLMLCGCLALQSDIDDLNSKLQMQHSDIAIQQSTINKMEIELTSSRNAVDVIMARQYCLDSDVARFLSDCSSGDLCTEKAHNDVLLHMHSQKHEVIYLKPEQTRIEERRALALKNLITENLLYSTKFIVLSHTSTLRSATVIQEMRNIAKQNGVSNLRIITPWHKPFRTTGKDITQLFRSHPSDKPLGEELNRGVSLQDGVWVFRTDCPIPNS